MSIPQLSRLQPVPLREAWPHEAGSFTPWLARCENLQLLGETIGMSLECEAQEYAVGDFSADIVCRDLNTDRYVLIENQIERTDHSHLGQLLTYAAGLKAATVVWIAATFREEHRAALDWLNEITTEDFNFIGIEIQLWRIGDSVPAPTFNIISKPNNWSREIRDSARESGELTEGKMLQREYWQGFMDYLRTTPDFPSPPKALAQYWMNFPIGRPSIRLAVVASTVSNRSKSYDIGELRMELVLDGVYSADYLRHLQQHSEEIESALAPDQTIWYNKEDVKMKKVYVSREADIKNRNDWPAQHQWLYQRLLKFDHVFRRRVAELPRGATGDQTTDTMISPNQ